MKYYNYNVEIPPSLLVIMNNIIVHPRFEDQLPSTNIDRNISNIELIYTHLFVNFNCVKTYEYKYDIEDIL